MLIEIGNQSVVLDDLSNSAGRAAMRHIEMRCGASDRQSEAREGNEGNENREPPKGDLGGRVCRGKHVDNNTKLWKTQQYSP